MDEFIPAGYVPIQAAFLKALEHWYRAELKEAEQRYAERMPKPTGDPVSDMIASQGPLQPSSEDMKLAEEARRRFRQLFYDGDLSAIYFGTGLGFTGPGEHSIEPGLWATSQGDGIIETGRYFPFGRPTRFAERRPYATVLIRDADLTTLLEGHEAKGPSREASAEAPSERRVSARALLDFLNSRADGQRRSSDVRAEASTHFGGQTFTERQWREAWGKVPREKKRRSGDTDRTLAVRNHGREDDGCSEG